MKICACQRGIYDYNTSSLTIERMSNNLAERALQYHEQPRPGKLEVLPYKSCFTIDDLTLAHSPGVAVPCLEIANDTSVTGLYTNRGNLVGVISNGTAVLGLGNIGAHASKPVMEGKGLLFKIYADVDVFDIELDIKKPETLIEVIKTMEPTFGAINLEDIKAPECFVVEQRLREEMNIPEPTTSTLSLLAALAARRRRK